MRLWLAALFTVAEGYQSLKLQDKEIDCLLASEHLVNLRRFRNGTFHYQRQPEKHLQFFTDGDTTTFERVEWAERLHATFDRYFNAYRLEVLHQNLVLWVENEKS